MDQAKPAKKSRLISYLFALTFIFILIQAAVYLITDQGVQYVLYLLRSKVLNVPAVVVWEQVWFVAAQILLYIVFTVAVWAMARLLGAYFKWTWQKTCDMGFKLWLFAVLAVIFSNQMLFPGSNFAKFLAVIVPAFLADILAWVSIAIVAVAALLSVWAALALMWRRSKVLNLSAIVAVCAAYFLFAFSQPVVAASQPATAKKPNVIIIGIDSLRPDYTGFGGYQGPYKPITPFLDSFMKQATVFSNAITPLARTFPSWTVTLTGLYPKHSGARFNLEDQASIHLKYSLARLLKKQGYTTYYSTDERRFSNIGKHFGFDAAIGPHTGANDFVLGTLNDFPLSNLVLNTRLGDWLFPYTAANRAAAVTYNPMSFNRLIERRLLTMKHGPLFLSIHFCLPHYPYIWSRETLSEKEFPIGLYSKAIKESDKQIQQFVMFLKQHHFLDHAIVVIESDHGESLMKPDGRLINEQHYVRGPHSVKHPFEDLRALIGKKEDAFSTSYGHGTDVLSWAQYHTVLAFRTFGVGVKNQPGDVAAPTSLVDIKPTILSLLKMPIQKTDGEVLTPYLKNPNRKAAARFRFAETGFTPSAIKKATISVKGAVVEGARVFAIEPNGYLIMKPDLVAALLQKKQRAVFYKNWVLALYPQANHQVIPVLVNRTTGQWTDDLGSRFAKTGPVNLLMAQLKKMYGSEVTAYCPYKAGCVL